VVGRQIRLLTIYLNLGSTHFRRGSFLVDSHFFIWLAILPSQPNLPTFRLESLFVGLDFLIDPTFVFSDLIY
jgi:hypothetical protein